MVQQPGAESVQKLNAEVLSNTLPDVFWRQTSLEQELGSQGHLLNGSSHMSGKAAGASSAGIEASKFSTGALDLHRVNGGAFDGVPYTCGVLYNADLPRKAGA